MTAEVIMIIKDQNLFILTVFLLVKIGSCQSAKSTTDNDQIERLVRLQRVLDDVAGSDTTVIDVSTAETTER